MNVMARLEGSDPALRDEYVVIGGHYDHVGYGHTGSLTGAWGQIHPGADDNASGTAAILAVAEALARAPQRPRRSILFMHFTAEEKGLMGSRWFVEHPTVPVAKMLAMINLDMVGRNDPAQLSVNGDAAAAGLDALIQRIAEQELGLQINHDAGSGIDRSDQWAFALKGVPAVAFFSGEHDDYHRPSDIPARIVPDKLERVARLAALVLWRVAEEGRELITVTSHAAGGSR
jgi:Zn-dependent M28 family amino/carboxypeptidase